MIFSYMRFFFFALLLMLLSCGKNEFTMQFELPEDITENYNVTYYGTVPNGGVTVRAVASVMKGTCILTGYTNLPTIVYLTSRNSNFPLVFYAKRGEKIVISGIDRDPMEWLVGGDKINEELSSWRKENLGILNGDDIDKINDSVAEFVRNNPENPVSLILLLNYFDRNHDEAGYSQLLAKLHGKVKKDNWLKIMANASLLNYGVTAPAQMRSLILRSNQDGADTIRISGEHPFMIWFWNHLTTDRKQTMDSLKLLLKEYPDTTSRIFADIYMDIDSVAWRNTIRRDSLGNYPRLWAPMAQMDADLSLLKIKEVPYFIVFDSIGKQSYRGADLTEAMHEFRRLHSDSDSIEEK